MNMKQSSTYWSCNAAHYSIHIFTFILKEWSIIGVLKLSNVWHCRNKSNDYGEGEEGFKGLEDWISVKLVVKIMKSVIL